MIARPHSILGSPMIQTLLQASHWLDAWLREHLGRPYLAILGVGLVFGIIATFGELGHEISSGASILKLGFLIAFQVALLINQLAQFHDYREERRQRREAKRAAASAADGL